jgi:polyferredoxin
MNLSTIKDEIKKPKNKKYITRTIRWISQVIFLIFFPSAFTAAFSGVKYIFTQFGTKNAVELTSFVTILIALCAFTLFFGRFFCGYACPFGTLGDFVRETYVFICKKLKKKPITINHKIQSYLVYIKYIILLVILILCFTGVYANLSGFSPWDVFSMIISRNFKFSGYTLGIIFLILIVAGMLFADRFFCRFLCPMGAVFAIIPVFPFFAVRRDKSRCIEKCKACKNVCPSGLDLPYEKTWSQNADCFQCGKCLDVCPKKSSRSFIGKFRGNEVWYTVLRVVVLVVVMILAKV